MENGSTPAERAYRQAKAIEEFGKLRGMTEQNTGNVLSMLKSEQNNSNYGEEGERVELTRKLTDLLEIKYVEGGYYITLWGFAISERYNNADDAEYIFLNNTKKRIDMILTATYGIMNVLLNDNNLINKQK